MAWALWNTCGSASSVSWTERSSAAWTIAVVPCVTKSHAALSGGWRLSSVKLVSIPPPTAVPGKASRATSTTASGARPEGHAPSGWRSEEHTSELQSLMRISYAVFCLKKKKKKHTTQYEYIRQKYTYTKYTLKERKSTQRHK